MTIQMNNSAKEKAKEIIDLYRLNFGKNAEIVKYLNFLITMIRISDPITMGRPYVNMTIVDNLEYTASWWEEIRHEIKLILDDEFDKNSQ